MHDATTTYPEPEILPIGRFQSTLDILVGELRSHGREVRASNDRTVIVGVLSTGEIDLVIIGGRRADPAREKRAFVAYYRIGMCHRQLRN